MLGRLYCYMTGLQISSREWPVLGQSRAASRLPVGRQLKAYRRFPPDLP